MRRRFLLCLILAATASIYIARASADDVVVMTSGRTVTGTIISETEEEITIRQAGGVIVLPRDSVSEVNRAPTSKEYFKKRAAIENPDDPGEHLELAQWCKKAGFEHLAKIEYRTVIRLDPDSTEAREELGYVRYGGRWVLKERLDDIRNRAIRANSPGDGSTGDTGTQTETGATETTPAPAGSTDPRKPLTGPATFAPPAVENVPWDKAFQSKSTSIIVFSNVSRKVASAYLSIMRNLFSEYGKVMAGKVLDSAPREVNVYSDPETMKEITQKDKDIVWYNTKAKRIEAVHDWRQTPRMLAHQGVYLYADRIMQNVYLAPKWLLEGLGAYFAGARISRRGRIERIQAPRDRLVRLKKAYVGGYHIPMDKLMITPRYRYKKNEIDASWGIVYFLLESGRKGKTAFAKIFEKAISGRVTTADIEAALGCNMAALELQMKNFILKEKIPPVGRTSGSKYDVSTLGFICTRPSKDWKLNTKVEEENVAGQYENGEAKIILRAVINDKHHSLSTVTNSVVRLLSKGYTRLERKAIKLGSPEIDGYLFSYSSKSASIGGSGSEMKSSLAVTANYDFRFSFELIAPADKFEAAEKDFQTFLASIKFITGE